MKLEKKEIVVIIFLITLVIVVNYSWMDSKLQGFLIQENYETTKITRVIDGDTVDSDIGKIRLLGINSPEKGEKYYQEAKDFLEEKVLNKTIGLEYGKDKKDRYERILAYLYLNRENINLKIVEQGLANYYFPSGKDIHYSDFRIAWESCIENNKNLCEKSENICGDCIEVKEFYSQEIVFFNSCNYDCNLKDWKIKDEGRKNFIFPDINLEKGKEIKIKVGEKEDSEDSSEILFWKGETYVWTRTGDTLFLRDDLGKLVLWKSY